MIKPPKLQSGDRIAVVSTSWGGAAARPHRYEAGKRQLTEAFGFELVEMPHTRKDAEWLARNPQARAEDLMAAFADPSIRGIIAAIGGDDSILTLPYTDLAVIRKNPKVFLGFSDSTITHLACFQAGLVSFYGPSVLAGFGESGGLFPYMVEAVRRAVFSAEPAGVLPPNTEGWTAVDEDWSDPTIQSCRRPLQPCTGWRFLQGEGAVEGPLLGGCLEVMDWLRGSSWWPTPEQWDGAILFIETSEEGPPPALVTYLLRAWAAAGVLHRVAAILVGRPGGGHVPVEKFPEYDRAVLRVVAEEQRLAIPVVAGMDFGHTDPMLVLPYGVRARVDVERREISLVESAVI